jgi:iron-sulfur cluster repair protein YtfE (RIC family)
MNPITRKMSPAATQMIRMDHTHVIGQFHKLAPDLSESVRAAVVRSICAELEIHTQLEEEIFYPALQESGISTPVLDKSVPEHTEIRRLIERVRSLDGQRTAQNNAVNELVNAVLHHMADEETQLLPAAEKFLGPDRLADLGARMTARRIELVKPRAAELAADLAGAAPAKTALVTVGALVAGTLLINSLRRGRHHARV